MVHGGAVFKVNNTAVILKMWIITDVLSQSKTLQLSVASTFDRWPEEFNLFIWSLQGEFVPKLKKFFICHIHMDR